MKPSNTEKIPRSHSDAYWDLLSIQSISQPVSSLLLMQCVQVADGDTNQADAGGRKHGT